MQNVYWKYVFFVLLFSGFATQGLTNEFCISREPEVSQFYRGFPALFFDNHQGFIVIWEDWRDGEYAGYAQRFDPTGKPVGKNFPLFGHLEVAYMPDGTLFSLTQKQVLETIEFEYIFAGQIQTTEGLQSPALPIYRTFVPFCGTGFLGQATGVLTVQNSFRAYVYYDGRLVYNQYDLSGNLLNAYTFSLEPDNYRKPAGRLFANGACQLSGNSVLTWYRYPNPHQNDSQLTNGYYATFFNAANEIIADSVRIDTCSHHYYRDFNSLSKTIAIDSSRFLFIWLGADSGAVNYQIFSDSGKVGGPVNTLRLTQFSDLPLDTDFYKFYLGPKSQEKFEIGLNYNVFFAQFVRHKHFIRLIFDSHGNLLDTIHSANAPMIWGDRYDSPDNQTVFAPCYSNAGLTLNKYKNDSLHSSIQLVDKIGGANQRKPEVIALDEQHFLVSWRDEQRYWAQKLTETGEQIGDPVQVSSQTFFRLSDSVCVNYNRNILNYYDSENLALIKRDSLSNKGLRGEISDYLVLADGLVLALRQGVDILILKLDFNGNIQAQIKLPESGYYSSVLGKHDTRSFWFNARRRLVLLSNSLEILRNIEKSYAYDHPFEIINPNTFLCKKIDRSHGSEIIIQDSTGKLQASLPFSRLPERNLNLRCVVIDERKFALLWTSEKDVYCQIFNENLESFGDPFVIHTQPAFYQEEGNGCRAGKNLFFVWADSRDFQQGYNIYGKFVSLKDLVSIEPLPVKNAPIDFVLQQNFPNPFNSSTMISFSNSGKIAARIQIFNTLGQIVRNWEYSVLEPGKHSVFWDGHDQDGSNLPSGVYFCRLLAERQVRQIKILLLR